MPWRVLVLLSKNYLLIIKLPATLKDIELFNLLFMKIQKNFEKIFFINFVKINFEFAILFSSTVTTEFNAVIYFIFYQKIQLLAYSPWLLFLS